MRQLSGCFILLFAFLLLQPCQGASAADWYAVPRIEFAPEYDSNINFSFDEKKGDIIFNINPSLDFRRESPTSLYSGTVALNGQAFVDNSNLDTINQNYMLSARQKVAPRFALTFNGGYTLDSTLFEELSASGFSMNRTRRSALAVNPGIMYDLTPRDNLSLGYSYRQVYYQDPRYSDYYIHLLGLDWRRQLRNQKTTLLATFQGRYVDYPDIGNLYRNLGTYVGVDHKFSEKWTLTLAGGLNYNWYSTQTEVIGTVNDPTFIQVPLGQTDKSFTVSPFFHITGTRLWTKTSLNFGYDLNQYPSASGVIRQFHNLRAELNHRFKEKLSGFVKGNVYYSVSTGEDINDERILFNISPGIKYQITEKFSLSSMYIYGWRRYISEGEKTDRHRVLVMLTYDYPLQYKK